ncbi:calcium-binding protein [Hansschlegelia beijingensis]|uniref:calcium-binding protein n=1 Tax=Hansschlegelia beijingensis TaxID=1133344 RepID=UPI00387F0677
MENLTLTGAAETNGTGNTLANIIPGNAAANHIDGGAGADTMRGGAGDDVYYVDDAGDRVVEASGQGVDTVFSSVGFSLAGQHVENLTLTGADDVNAVGNALANVLTGNSGSNQLNGGAGADIMAGGLGDDVYLVDDVGDQVIEAANAGNDTVRSSITHTLGANVENLVLTGAGDVNGVGNTLANMLTGNSGNNQLNGGAGADTMRGGAGDDVYLVDNVGDQVIEAANAGTDTVRSSITYTLAANVESLVLTGAGDIDGVGNGLANTLRGNSGSNQLDGGAGADTMTGGAGADYFLFSSALGAGNVDQITDFKHADDTIRLDGFVFSGLSLGELSSDAFHKAAGAAAAQDGAHRIIYDTTTGALFFDQDGDGSAYEAVRFATLTSRPAHVDNTDFVIV